jgi:hypothetical protein
VINNQSADYVKTGHVLFYLLNAYHVIKVSFWFYLQLLVSSQPPLVETGCIFSIPFHKIWYKMFYNKHVSLLYMLSARISFFFSVAIQSQINSEPTLIWISSSMINPDTFFFLKISFVVCIFESIPDGNLVSLDKTGKPLWHSSQRQTWKF